MYDSVLSDVGAMALESDEIIGYADGEPIFAHPLEPERWSFRSDAQVYFIQAVNGGPIKIGMAEDPDQRLRELQIAHSQPLRICHTLPGGRRREKRLHERFAHCRLRGEWFEPVPELVKLAYAR